MFDYKVNIQNSGLTIYDPIAESSRFLYIPTNVLEHMLKQHLIGLSLDVLPLRTRSKVVKSEICKALGYPVPKSFARSKPRFISQNFDVYVQKSLNLQIWNSDIDDDVRYVLIKLDEQNNISALRVVSGKDLRQFDTTNKVTQKHQAKMKSYLHNCRSSTDTDLVHKFGTKSHCDLSNINPNDPPSRNTLLSLEAIFKKLTLLVGRTVHFIHHTQDRNRGAELHKLVCKQLGYDNYHDDGKFPDLMNQLLEVKLQTSSTIDLGMHLPSSEELVIVADDTTFTSRDIRYAVIVGVVNHESGLVTIDKIHLVTGAEFNSYFPLTKDGQTNTKKQLKLPVDFFQD